MLTKIKAKLDSRFDYSGTLFDEITVIVPDKSKQDRKHDPFSALLAESLGTHYIDQDQSCLPRIDRIYILSDGRYNPIYHSWNFYDFIDKLKTVYSFGPLEVREAEEHDKFSVQRPSIEDKFVSLKLNAVYLNEWLAEPVYYIGQFHTLRPAIETLENIADYLKTENLV